MLEHLPQPATGGQDRVFPFFFLLFYNKHSLIRCFQRQNDGFNHFQYVEIPKSGLISSILMIALSSKWSLPGSISIWVVILSHTFVLYLQAECKMKHIKVWGKWKRGNSPESFFFGDNRKMFNPNLRPFWYLNPVFCLGFTPQREWKKKTGRKFLVTFN